MTTAEVQAEDPAAAHDDSSPGGAAEDSEEGVGEEEPEAGDDLGAPLDDPTDQALPDDAVRAYYGWSQSSFSGPAAFGPGGIAVGAVNITGESRSSDGFVTSPLPEPAVAEMLETYAGTGVDHELQQHLSVRSLVYLSGGAGAGVPTTATVAVARRHAPNQVARVMPLEPALVQVIGEPGFLLEGHGHILDLGSDGKLERAHLEMLETRAQRLGATVIVLSRTDGDEPDFGRYLVRHERPANEEVFRNWLGYELRQAGRCVGACPECQADCYESYLDRCLSDDSVTAQLRDAWEVADVVQLAKHCAREVPAPGEAFRLPDAAAGRRRQASKLLDLDCEQFGGKRNTQHLQAFRIAYALLNGVSVTHVFAAVGELVDLLDRAQRRRQNGRSILELDVDELLGPGVRPDADEAGAGTASGTAPRAKLRDARLADAVLDVVWNDYDSLRRPLLTWIRGLGNHTHATVRQYVAAATGRLCGYDFEEIREEVIDVWAAHERRTTRQTAALALESAAFNEHLTLKVLRCVRELVARPSDHRRDVAARVYATRFGRPFYRYALADLGSLARDPAQERNGVVARAVASVYDSATAREVLATLREWASVEGPEAGHADRCFALLARQSHDAEDGWPQLLADAAADTWRQEDLAQLWHSALLRPWTASGAWQALGFWVNSADRNPGVADALADLLTLVFVDPPLIRRASFHMGLWRRQMPDNPFLDRIDALFRSRKERHDRA